MNRDEFADAFHAHVGRLIDERGVTPSPLLVLEADGTLSWCALMSDLSPAQVYGFTWRKILVAECRGLILGLDRWTKPGQGTEFADALVCLEWWRREDASEGEHPPAGDRRVGVINYRHEPRVVRPWDWENRFWTDAVTEEFSKTCPPAILVRAARGGQT